MEHGLLDFSMSEEGLLGMILWRRHGFSFGLWREKQKTRLGLESGSAVGIQAALGRSLRVERITIVAGPIRGTRRVYPPP
jgi:hypothetical protein